MKQQTITKTVKEIVEIIKSDLNQKKKATNIYDMYSQITNVKKRQQLGNQLKALYELSSATRIYDTLMEGTTLKYSEWLIAKEAVEVLRILEKKYKIPLLD